MTTTLTPAQVQARQIRIAAGANGWDAACLTRQLREAGLKISYEKIRRAWNGERKSELDGDICRTIADVTGFPLAWIRGDSYELPEWVVLRSQGNKSTLCHLDVGWFPRPMDIHAETGRLVAA